MVVLTMSFQACRACSRYAFVRHIPASAFHNSFDLEKGRPDALADSASASHSPCRRPVAILFGAQRGLFVAPFVHRMAECSGSRVHSAGTGIVSHLGMHARTSPSPSPSFSSVNSTRQGTVIAVENWGSALCRDSSRWMRENARREAEHAVDHGTTEGGRGWSSAEEFLDQIRLLRADLRSRLPLASGIADIVVWPFAVSAPWLN